MKARLIMMSHSFLVGVQVPGVEAGCSFKDSTSIWASRFWTLISTSCFWTGTSLSGCKNTGAGVDAGEYSWICDIFIGVEALLVDADHLSESSSHMDLIGSCIGAAMTDVRE